jgi:formylglycine-generating enzyme required for sulfatase activity
MTCSPENSELSSLLRNYNALLEGSFWSTEISNSQLEKAVDTASEEDENETIEQLQEKYGNYKIYKIPFYIPEGITQAYLNIGRSTTIYFDKSSLTGNGKIFIEIPQITFRLNESEAAKKATLEGLAYELDLAEVKGDYKPEYRFVEESTGLKKKRIDLGDDITMEFVYIPAGEFMMGSPSNEGRRFHDESPQHRVKISKGFWMGVYEVTNEQYQQFVKESNYDGERESNANYLSFHAGLDYPVCTVSWDNARAFCEWLSVKEGKTYRLPTEAQWEYACRAGRTKELNIKDDGLFLNTSGGRAASMRHTHPAGQNKPNPFGLYDMYDNVREWCRDWYGSYSDTAEVDPEGPSSGDERVVRGDYSGEIISYRCAERSSNPPDKPSHEIGFRIVCDDSE